MRSTSHHLTRRFPRIPGGYSPPAVRAVISELNTYYQRHEASLSAHLRDLVHVVDLLKLVVEMVESVLTALTPASPAGPAEAWQPVPTWQPALPSPPALKRLPSALIGYSRRAVRGGVAELRLRWETELGVRIAEAVKLDAERLSYMVRLSRAQQHLKGAQLKPLAPAVHIQTVDNVVPLKSREVKVALQARAVAASAPAGVKIRQVWRPGLTEETEAIASGAIVAPAYGAQAPPAAGTRSLGRIQLGRVGDSGTPSDQAQAESLALARAQAQVAASADQPTGQSPISPSFEAQVHAGLTARLELLFQRFLVGKALGADLVLPNGTTLAGKGTLITRDLVQRAEEAGLLPTLIAHMTVPGVAAD